MRVELGIHGLVLADMVVEGSFFVMQIYLTNVWKLSFSTAATFLNIWGGIHRILPLLFLFLADTILGNFITLALSAVFSTTGLILITVTSGGGYTCQEKGEKEECVGQIEKAIFITAMGLLALGRAACAASTRPFHWEQQDITPPPPPQVKTRILIFAFQAFVPLTTSAVFPYVKKWYLVWGVAAVCTALATLMFFCNFRAYIRKGPRKDGSPLTGLVRVFVVSAFNVCQPSPKLDDPRLHVGDGEEFKKLSTSNLLGFLHKAAIKHDDDRAETKKLRPCSVSEVESAKILIRMVPVHTAYLMCGVVSSIANTYLVEQADQMNTSLYKWEKPPLQIFSTLRIIPLIAIEYFGAAGGGPSGPAAVATISSIVCCAVAAAVERRRLHVVRRHGVVDGAKAPMSAYWLLFPFLFLSFVDVIFLWGLSRFHKVEGPESMERYNDCLVAAVSGLGYMCGALSVYVVGKVSKMGSGKGWFQHTLNRSRLDRYYWLLAAVTTLNLFICILVRATYRSKMALLKQMEQQQAESQEEEKDKQNDDDSCNNE